MMGAERFGFWVAVRLRYDTTCSTYETTSADDVIVTVPEEGIYLTMIALLKPGDHVVRRCVGPCAQRIRAVATAAGGSNPRPTRFYESAAAAAT